MREELREQIIKVYGFNDGLRIFGMVLPNIEKDFLEELSRSMVGLEKKEEYCFDDREGSITLVGVKEASGKCVIREIVIKGNGQERSVKI